MEFLPVSFSPQLLLLAAAVIAAAALLSSAVRLMRDRKSLKPRRYYPVVGTVLHHVVHFSRLYEYQMEHSRRHKSFRILTTPFTSDAYTTDPVVIEHILRSNFGNYGKGDHHHEITMDVTGDGFIGIDGSKWRHQRKLLSFAFSTKSLKEHSERIFKKNAVKLAQAVYEAATSHQAIEAYDWLTKSSMDSIFEVTMGKELKCLDGATDEDQRFVRAIDGANVQLKWRYCNPLWKLVRFLNLGSEATLRASVKVIDDYVYKAIDSMVAQMPNQGNGSFVKKADILSRFLQESEKDPKDCDRQYLRDIVVNFVIAGKGSISGTLSWFFYMLCKHPSVQEKVAQEVKEVVEAGENVSFQEFAAKITEESLDKMQYIHAALTETLRLYPAIPEDSRVCFSDDTLPDGFDLRAGEIIGFQPYVMGRMEYLWGEDAEEFRPERWLDENGIFCPESPFKFTAFLGGPRMCLGKDFAYRQMKIVVAVLLRFFVFKLRNEKETIEHSISLTLLLAKGLYLHAFQR